MDYLIVDDQQQKIIRVISDVGPSYVGQGEYSVALWHQSSLGPVMMDILKTYGWHVKKNYPSPFQKSYNTYGIASAFYHNYN